MIASPQKTIFTLLVCGLTLFNTTGAAQACWLTDWLWGKDAAAVPVAPPVITTGYAPVAYPVQTVNYQSAVCGPTCPPVAAPATTVGFLPRVDYQSQYQTIPTTVYRPVPVYQPNSAGVPVVGYQGCTTSRTQVQRVPTATFAPAAAASSCGCASQGYGVQPMPSVSGGTIPSTQPSTWVPRTDDTLLTPQTYPQGQVPGQIQGQIQAAPNQGGYDAGGSIYQSQPSTLSPAPMVQPQQQYIQQPQTQYQQQPQSQYQQQPQAQPMQPADQRPALRPELQQNPQYQYQQQNQNQQEAPALNGSGNGNNGANGNNGSNGANGNTQGSTSMVYPQPMQPAPGMMQRPAPMTVSPSSSSPSEGSSWQVAPVTPIPDPAFSTSGPENEAPQLLDPRDKTAGLDQPGSVVPVSYEMSRQRPAPKPPTASIRAPQSQDSGWYSTGQ